MKWTTTATAAMEHGIKILTYGRSGTGKTSLIATAPAPVILSAESGLLSLQRPNIERMFGVATPGIAYDIPVIQIETVEDLTEAYTFLTSSAHAAQFQTVALDSISEIGEKVLANHKPQFKDPRQAYGALIDTMADLIRAFRDLPGKHVYFSAKMERVKDEGTGAVLNGPAMPGSKLQQMLPYWFDELVNIDVSQDANGDRFRFLRTQADLQHEAKDRSGALLPIEIPNLSVVFQKITAATQQQ